jgi:hemerythrin superfamily protein
MKIYDTLISDHRNVEELMQKLVATPEQDHETWNELVEKIRDELIPHSRAEEALFYNAINDSGGDKKVLAHSYAEHAAAEAELRMLQAVNAIDANRTSLAKKLQEDLRHHIAEEEGAVFAEAKKVFTDEDALMLNEAFLRLKPLIKQKSIVGTSIDLVKNMLPEKVRKMFRIDPLEQFIAKD